MGNTARHCRLGLFQDSDFAGDLEHSKSTSCRTLCTFGSNTFVPRSWMCKKQTCVSHRDSLSVHECEWTEFPRLISGIWSLMCYIQVQIGNINSSMVRGNPSLSVASEKRVNFQCNTQVSQNHFELSNVDLDSTNVNSSHEGAMFYIFEDSEAVIYMIFKGRPILRHVSRTHRVALNWLFERINLDPKIPIRYVDSKNQLADILTKGHFTRDEWNHLLCLFYISVFSSQSCCEFNSQNCSDAKAKRRERVVAKSTPVRTFGIEELCRGHQRVPTSTACFKPGEILIKRSRNEV